MYEDVLKQSFMQKSSSSFDGIFSDIFDPIGCIWERRKILGKTIEIHLVTLRFQRAARPCEKCSLF